MNIYLISQSKNKGYDTFDSAVVVAESPEQARFIHPAGALGTYEKWWESDFGDFGVWVHPGDVEVEWIGIASFEFTSPQIICASFNAG